MGGLLPGRGRVIWRERGSVGRYGLRQDAHDLAGVSRGPRGRARRRRLLHGRGLDATRPDPLHRAGLDSPGQPPRSDRLFEIFSQRYEQASTLVTSNLPFNEWTEIFGSERLTGALLDRLTQHVHILELNGDSYRLEHSKKARQHPAAPTS